MTNFESVFGRSRTNEKLISLRSIIDDDFRDYVKGGWDVKIKHSISLYEAGKFLDAKKSINDCILMRDGHALSYILKGNIEEDLKQYSSAISTYEKALDLCEDNHASYFQIAYVYSKLEDYNKTSDGYMISLSLKQKNDNENDYPRLKWGIPFNVDIEKIYGNLANAKINLKDFDGAILDCESAIKHNKFYSNGYFFKASALKGLNKDKEALEYLNQAATMGNQFALQALRYWYI